MRLLDKKRNQIVNVSDNLVNEALSSGNYELRPGVRVPVVLPDGTKGELDSEEMPKAVSMGVRYRTSQEDRDAAQAEIAAIKKESLDKPAVAATFGALRGATLGLSDVAARGIGSAIGLEDTAGTLRGLQQENPKASLAGEIAGGVAAFVTPAGSLGAASRVLGAPTRAATDLGLKAAQVIGRGAESLSTAQKIGRAVVGGAVEGAAIGAGQTVSELALADPELTAQKAITNIGLGSLFGGALSGTARGAFEGVKSATVAGLDKLSKTELLPKSAAALAGRLSELYGSASKMARADLQLGDDFTRIWNEANAQGRVNILDASRNKNKLLQDVADQFEDIKSFGSDLSKVAKEGADIQASILDAQTGRAPKKMLDALDNEEALQFGTDAILKDRVLTGPNLVKAEKAAGFEVFDRVQQAGKNLVNDGDSMLAKMREANATERSFGRAPIYDDATIRDFAGRLEDYSKTVTSATKPSQVASAMTTFKNEVAPLFAIPKGKTLDLIKVENRPLWETVKELRPYWAKVKETTVSKDVFGELGAAMATRAEAISSVLRSTDDLLSGFYRITPGETMNARKYVPDMAKINSYMVNPDAARNLAKGEAIDKIKERISKAITVLKPIDVSGTEAEIKRLSKELAKAERVPANKAGAATKQEKIDFLQKQISAYQDEIARANKFNGSIDSFKSSAQKRVQSFEKAFDIAREKRAAILMLNAIESSTGKSLMGGLVGGLGGSAIENTLGTESSGYGKFIGAVGGLALTNPMTALRYISAMENAAVGLDKMSKNAAARFKSVESKMMAREGVTKIIPAVRQTLIREKLKIDPNERPKDDEAAFKAHRKKLGELQQNPEALFDRIYDAAGDEALSNPRTTFELYNTAQRGIAFLESKIPKDPYNPGVYVEDFTPSPVEMSEYSDYVQAVMRPKTIIKQMAAGDINPRTVEAIRSVYPKMYDDMLTQVTGYLMEPKKVPYDQRVQLGILFGVPAVKAMQPDYLARMLAMRQNGQQQPQEQQQASTQSNRSQMVSFREMKSSEREQRS